MGFGVHCHSMLVAITPTKIVNWNKNHMKGRPPGRLFAFLQEVAIPRNGSGVYSLPEPAFIPQTPISSSAVNNDLSDIATALTGSLPRNGEAGMTNTLPLSANGFNYVIDPDTGMRRSGANEQMIFCGGTDVVKITTEGLFDGVSGASLGFVIGVPYVWTLDAVPTGCVFLYGQPCTTTYPLYRAMLLAAGSPYGTSGSDPLFPDYRGVVPVGKSNMGGVDKGNLTGATVLGAILGAQTVTLDATMIPAHTHGVSGTTGGESQGHTHNVAGNTGNESVGHTHTASGQTGGMSGNNPHSHQSNDAPNKNAQVQGGTTVAVWSGITTSATSSTDIQHVHDFNLTTTLNNQGHVHPIALTSGTNSVNHTHTINLTSASTGGGAAHANVQPSIVQNYIMRVA